jgi:hypothetical protein
MSMSGLMEEVTTTRFTVEDLLAADKILTVMSMAGIK